MQILAGHAQDDKAPSRHNHMTKHEIMHVSRCGGNALAGKGQNLPVQLRWRGKRHFVKLLSS